eukprot:5311955-Amphidinium_carterae.1
MGFQSTCTCKRLRNSLDENSESHVPTAPWEPNEEQTRKRQNIKRCQCILEIVSCPLPIAASGGSLRLLLDGHAKRALMNPEVDLTSIVDKTPETLDVTQPVGDVLAASVEDDDD